jgi:hypothetical protein
MCSSRAVAALLMLVLAAAAVLAGCAAKTPAPVPADAPAPPAAVAAEPSRVVVSYFHRTIRCETCLRFETLTDRVLREAFAGELADGRLEWRVMDFEEPGHEAEVAKYDIFESALIVSRIAGDDETEWKKLDAIWNLVADDALFLQYVQGEVAAYLDAAPAVGGDR